MRLLLLLFFLPALISAGVSVSASDHSGVSFTYQPGNVRLIDGQRGSAVQFEDADNLAVPGEFDLPGRIVRIGLPQSGGVRVSVKTGPVRVHTGVEVRAVPFVSWDGDSAWYGDGGRSQTQELGARKSEAGRPGGIAADLVSVGPVEVLRGVRFVTVTISPCQYDPLTRELVTYERLEISAEFERVPALNRIPDPLDGPCATMLLNGAQAIDWKLDFPASSDNQFSRSPNWLKIRVDSTGIHAIGGNELAAAGVPPGGIDPTSFAMYTIGEHEPNKAYPDSMREVAVHVAGAEDGTFDPADRIIFYGQGPEHWVGAGSAFVKNYFTRYNVYWLTWGGAAGRRMPKGLGPDTAGVPVLYEGREILHQERDLDCPARSGLLWIWTQMYKAGDGETARARIPLDIRSASRVTRVGGRLLADSPGNQLTVQLNGRAFGYYECGQAPPSAPFDFSDSASAPANSGANTLALELAGAGQKTLWLDYLEVEYRRRLSLHEGQLHFLQDDTGTFQFCVREASERPYVLDVTDPYRPQMCDSVQWSGDSARFCRAIRRRSEFAVGTPGQLMRPAGIDARHPGRLRDRVRQADYWIVTPREFAVPAAELARYRTGRVAGIVRARAEVAILDEVYDDYAFGMEEPGAIKGFLADKRPAYGLLAGDATCDYKGILGERPPGVPTYEYGFGLNPDAYDRSALAFDAWYADYEGQGGSPDMVLGRVTPRSAAEMKQFVRKVIGYETQPVGTWSKRYMLLADDEFFGEADPDNPKRWDPIGFGHIAYCEAMSLLPDNKLDLVKVYLTEWPYVGIKNKPGAHIEFMRQMGIGAAVLAFFGHGAGFDLTHESVLNISQVPQINNGLRSPFCYFGSCSVGRFDDTQFECISEELVRQPSGAIATVGATKATTAGSNSIFARNLLTPLFTMLDSTIGYSFFQAWPTDKIYHLFGDPATVLRLPRQSTEQPVVSPDTLVPGASFLARGLLEVPRGEFSWTLSGPRRNRTYRSFRGEVTYGLPGLEMARGSGSLEEGMFSCAGTFPLGVPLDTVFVPSGWYAPLPGTCRFSMSVAGESVDLGVLRDTIKYTRTAASLSDSAGPAVAFLLNNRPLEDSAVVPAEFDVDGVVSDPAGIMIAAVPGQAPQFYVDDRRYAEDLTDRLVFDAGSSRTARFRSRVKLAGPVDSLFAVVSDNLLNQSVSRVIVRPLGSDELRVESGLVYPNPVRRAARFTFVLTRDANVRVRVYSLSGRLVCDLGWSSASFGYNQVEWDGRDGQGRAIANGVYLYSVTAQVEEGAGRVDRSTFRDKLIVMR